MLFKCNVKGKIKFHFDGAEYRCEDSLINTRLYDNEKDLDEFLSDNKNFKEVTKADIKVEMTQAELEELKRKAKGYTGDDAGKKEDLDDDVDDDETVDDDDDVDDDEIPDEMKA